MFYIKVIDTQNKIKIIDNKTKSWQVIKNIIDIFKIKNNSCNLIKIFLKYQNN